MNRWTFAGSLSLDPLVRKDRETWELFGVAVKGKQKRNKGKKGDESTATRHTTRSLDPFSFRTDKTLTEALDALFFVTIV
jgi:hypothetical protein